MLKVSTSIFSDCILGALVYVSYVYESQRAYSNIAVPKTKTKKEKKKRKETKPHLSFKLYHRRCM